MIGRRLGIVALALAGWTAARAQPPAIVSPAPDYAVAAAWLCRPGQADSPCARGFDAVAVNAAGERTPRPAAIAADPPIDCFYVYPTTSNDPAAFSDLAFDDSEKATVRAQAARLGEECRLFVPGYRQLTRAGLRAAMRGGPLVPAQMPLDTPYRDVRAAWRAYLARDNGGRGVVLVGHSQGAMLLKRLIAEEIDGKPAQRRFVGAYLAGNTDLTARSFRTIRPCAAVGATGCFVAWSSYRAGDDDGARVFGGGADAICVNPAAIGGGRGMVDAFLPKPGMAPTEDPPFVEAKGQLSAECVADAAGAVLRVRAEPGRYTPLLEAMLAMGPPHWGLHVLDIALVEGDVVADIAAQGAAWRAR